jgi:hypothetical protein
MPRVISYIDGFNLDFGLKSQGWEGFAWPCIPIILPVKIGSRVPLARRAV